MSVRVFFGAEGTMYHFSAVKLHGRDVRVGSWQLQAGGRQTVHHTRADFCPLRVSLQRERDRRLRFGHGRGWNATTRTWSPLFVAAVVEFHRAFYEEGVRGHICVMREKSSTRTRIATNDIIACTRSLLCLLCL